MPNFGPKDEVLSRKYISLHNRYKSKKKQLWKLKFAKLLIHDLKKYGPANIFHMEALSALIGKPIRIWLSGVYTKLYKIINRAPRDKNTTPVDIEYHNCKSTYRQIGHWTLIGGKDPLIKRHLNGCMFEVIAAQTGNNGIDLRYSTVKYLKNNINSLIDQINDTLSSNDKRVKLMVGGCRYHGTSPRAAAIILDQSQNVYCHQCRQKGHPRGHASDKNATGPLDSVENYSRTSQSMKSGFLSRSDQDAVAHYALSHRTARSAMESLNNGSISNAVMLPARDLQIAGCNMPKMKEWCDGKECSDLLDIVNVQLVLRHHEHKFNDPDADVFIHTVYPKSR